MVSSGGMVLGEQWEMGQTVLSELSVAEASLVGAAAYDSGHSSGRGMVRVRVEVDNVSHNGG